MRKQRQIKVHAFGEPAPDNRTAFVTTVPGVEAPVVSFDFPEGVGGQVRRRIARQQLSDRLGGPAAEIALMPLTLGGVGENRWTHAIVVEKARLKDWTAGTTAESRALLPDYMTLSAADGWAILDSDGVNVRARIGLHDGFAAPSAAAAAMLKLALDDTVSNACVTGDVPEACLSVLREHGVTLHDRGPGAAFRHGEMSLDLRRAGDENQGDVEGLGLLASAAAASLAAFALWAAGVAVETRALAAQTAEIQAETESVLRERLIPEGPILDIRAQVTRTLSDTGSAAQASKLTSAAAHLSDISLALFGRGVTVSEIVLTEEGASIDILAPDFAAADAVQREMREAGLVVSAETSRATEDGVAVRLNASLGTGDSE